MIISIIIIMIVIITIIYIYNTYVCIYMNQTTANIIPHIKQIGLGREDVIILYIYMGVTYEI